MPAEKIKILFLCTGNACRSQIAEAWAHRLKSDILEAHSAGVVPKGVDPRATIAMSETEIDISGQSSKDIVSLGNLEFDYVMTLCDKAHEACPLFPAGTKVAHAGFDYSPRLAASAKTEEEAMAHYRRVRDELWNL